MTLRKWACLLVFLLIWLVPVSGGADGEEDINPAAQAESEYLQVTGPCRFQFPRDHGAHPGHRFEWWYYTGHIHSKSGRAWGFQLTFFRVQVLPSGSSAGWSVKPSKWRTTQIFMAHAALSDLDEKRFYFDEKIARGAVGLAGAEQAEAQTKVFLGPWSAVLTPKTHRLKAAADRFQLDLRCQPLKPPVAHGDDGYSRKGSRAEHASCYYSFTRLGVSGKLTLAGETFAVDGTAWMDHEYSTAPL